jgi:hypothetical protein
MSMSISALAAFVLSTDYHSLALDTLSSRITSANAAALIPLCFQNTLSAWFSFSLIIFSIPLMK